MIHKNSTTAAILKILIITTMIAVMSFLIYEENKKYNFIAQCKKNNGVIYSSEYVLYCVDNKNMVLDVFNLKNSETEN